MSTALTVYMIASYALIDILLTANLTIGDFEVSLSLALQSDYANSLPLDISYEEGYVDYIGNFSKLDLYDLDDETELVNRYNQYVINMKYIDSLNNNDSILNEYGQTQFTDWYDDEINDLVDCQPVSSLNDEKLLKSCESWRGPPYYKGQGYGAYVVAPNSATVKNQGLCASCWAFAATSQFETNIWLQYGNCGLLPCPYSDQFVLDCSNVGDCTGGNQQKAVEWYVEGNGGGGCFENEYAPYTAQKNPCGACSGSIQPAPKCVYVDSNDPLTISRAASFVGFAFTMGVGADFPHFTGINYYNCYAGIIGYHSMATIGGYYSTLWNQPYIAAKNSYGPTWGNGGYVNIWAPAWQNCGVLNFNFEYWGTVSVAAAYGEINSTNISMAIQSTMSSKEEADFVFPLTLNVFIYLGITAN
eukprot:143902_1